MNNEVKALIPSKYIRARNDLLSGLFHWRIWSELAFREIRNRYKGSFFSHLWIALSLGIFIFLVGHVYSLIFSMRSARYIPFFCAGLISWRFITHIINEGSNVFAGSAGYIKGYAFPISIYIYKVVFKNILIYGHYLLVYLVVLIIYKIPVTLETFLVIPGILIILLNAFWVIMLLGIICTRFRDFQQIIGSFVLLMFFVTPVFWPESMIESYREFIIYNPFYHILELVRSPLLGNSPDLLSWFVGLGVAITGFVMTLPLYARFRTRIVYWL